MHLFLTRAGWAKKAFDTLEGLSPGGGVEAKCQRLEPQGEDKGGEQNHKGSPTPDDPKGSAADIVTSRSSMVQCSDSWGHP